MEGDAPVLGAQLIERRPEVLAVAEGPGIVRHHPVESHPELSEEGGRAAQETGTGGAALITQDFAVSEPRMIIHQGMDVVVAEAPLHPGVAGAAMDPVPSARRDPSQFLDVEMPQIAGLRRLIAADLPGEDMAAYVDRSRPEAIAYLGRYSEPPDGLTRYVLACGAPG